VLDERHGLKGSNMRKAIKKKQDEIAPEYDFSAGVRGKYASRFAEGTNIVVLEPDLVRAFPDSNSVNAALRMFVDVARRSRGA
jgi:hypothetical protein